MKKIVNLLFLCLLTVLAGCKKDITSAGQGVLPTDDQIVVMLDTFRITSSLDSCGSLISTPDSFLVGELETSYGVLRAEVLTQMAAPVGFTYPDGSEVDSILLFLYYRSHTGDTLAPMELQVYEMDKATLTYDGVYMSDINIDDYCSKDDSTLVTKYPKLVVASQMEDSVYSSNRYIPAIKFEMNDDFVRRFFSIKSFTSQEEFNRIFKGFYITSEFGSSTVFHITDIGLAVYYHFPYERYNPDTRAKDTVIESDFKSFYANAEVKQVNRFKYMNEISLLDSLNQYTDLLNFIVSPAGVYTRLHFPIKDMVETFNTRVGIDNKRNLYVNMAQLKVRVLYNPNVSEQYKDRDNWMTPAPNMLLVLDSIRDEFFRDKLLMLSTTYASHSSLLTGLDSYNEQEYYYSFDLRNILMEMQRKELSNPGYLDQNPIQTMTLVPISVDQTTSSNGTTSITAIKQLQTLSATIIPSPTNPDTPLVLEVVYSGF